MSALTIPNAVGNGLPADGNELDANFDSIKSWADTHVVEKSGATFTGDVVLAGNPSVANGAATKSYVDNVTVNTANLAAGAVTSAKIADGTIATGDIADGAVTSAKILDGTIATADLADGAVTSAKIADGTIVTADLADNSVTSAKIVDGTIVNGDLASAKFTNVRGTAKDDLCFRAYRSAGGAIVSATLTVLVFDVETHDYGADYNTANGHYTVPEAGVYQFNASVAWATGSSVGHRGIEIRRYNSGGTLQEILGQQYQSAGDNSADQAVTSCSGETLAAATDIVRVHVYQDSGAGLNVLANLDFGCFFSGHCVRLTA